MTPPFSQKQQWAVQCKTVSLLFFGEHKMLPSVDSDEYMLRPETYIFWLHRNFNINIRVIFTSHRSTGEVWDCSDDSTYILLWIIYIYINLTCHDFNHFRTFYEVPIAKMWCEVGSLICTSPLPPQLGCVRSPGVCIHPNSRIFSCLVVRHCTLNPKSGRRWENQKAFVHCRRFVTLHQSGDTVICLSVTFHGCGWVWMANMTNGY